MAAARQRIWGVLVALMAIATLTGCSTTNLEIPWPQPTWHLKTSHPSYAAADDICPQGQGPRGLDCRSKAPGYKACMKRHLVKNSAKLCQQALIVRIECRSGERAIFHTEQVCASSFESYLSCRTGTPKRSDHVCATGEREFLRCPGYFDPASNFDCVKARDAYYDCRDDTRGEYRLCSTYIEIVDVCYALRVSCSDLLDKYLICGSGWSSPNECAFGATMRVNCLHELKAGVFLQAATCDSIWSNHLRDCAGRNGMKVDGPTPCTGGANWNEISYSICEKQGDSAEVVGVDYVNPEGRNYRLPVCWAPKSENNHMLEEAEHAIGRRSVRVIHRLGETRYESM
ncbi:hypothetical protein ACFHYQ_23095 [Sphaerimonospora cavernae]|uniref:Uncharacterized protein n=1 Tax=Sphaerimonospora cavernae TaxID=1740611 RepID=A0ABV6UAJ5_9ACTN